MAQTIGIDLGTSKSCVAVFEDGKPKVLDHENGVQGMPSMVSYLADGGMLVGAAAQRQAPGNLQNTMYCVKRLIGRKFAEPEVQRALAVLPFRIVAADNGDAWIDAQGRRLAVPQISAEIVRALKVTAEEHLGQPVTEAVIAVPAYFNDAQRQATRDAGRIAGLDVRRIIAEPTATALSFGLANDLGARRRIAVYDLGGGTFDLSIIEISRSGNQQRFDVVSSIGDTFLGGADFDQRLCDHLAAELHAEFGIDVGADITAMQRIRSSAQRARIALSSQQQAFVRVPFVAADRGLPLHLVRQITRTTLESITGDLIERTIVLCRAALETRQLAVGQIDDVLMVGGLTRMPAVRQALTAFFGQPPRAGTDVGADQAVAVGAALQGAILAGECDEVLVADLTPLSLDIEAQGSASQRMIPKNTSIPTTARRLYTTIHSASPSMSIKAYQSEGTATREQRMVGEFSVEDVAEAPRGAPQLDLTFDLDADGILHVHALDITTGKQRSVTPLSGLSEDEIAAMLRDAEARPEHGPAPF